MKFTQFLYPNGRKQEVFIDNLSAETESKAHDLTKAGFRFEIECLTVGDLIHADCCDEIGQLASKLFSNGPEVPIKVEELVKTAYDNWLTWGKPLANSDWLDKLEIDEDLL